MINLFCIVFSPALLLISVPLIVFAFFTTTFAFSTLFFRVLIVYAELAAVLIRDRFAPILTNSGSSRRKSITPTSEAKESRGKSRQGSTGSGQSNGGSITPKAPESNGLGIYGSGGIERDFEGVGGWRVPGSDDDDVLWTSMNSRLELPAIVDERNPNHRRSLTSSSLSPASLIPQSSTRSLTRHPATLYAAGATSPDEYFSNRATSKSTTALDVANVGKALLRRKTSSTSTFPPHQV